MTEYVQKIIVQNKKYVPKKYFTKMQSNSDRKKIIA